MKRVISTCKKGLLGLVLVFAAQQSFAQANTFQFIHNAADPSLQTIDIYVGGNLVFDNFQFRTSQVAPVVLTGVDLPVGIAPGTSTSAADTIYNTTVKFAANTNYVFILNGVNRHDTTGFKHPSYPPNQDITLKLISTTTGASNLTSTQFGLMMNNGVPDVGNIVPIQRGGNPIIPTPYTLSYGTILKGTSQDNVTNAGINGIYLIDLYQYVDATHVKNVPIGSYLLDTRDVTGYGSLGGKMGVLFYSGFLDSTKNRNGERAGLFIALDNGLVIKLVELRKSYLQFVNASADPTVAKVDIYMNGNLVAKDLDFRTGTPGNYMFMPDGKPQSFRISTAGANDSIGGSATSFYAGTNNSAFVLGLNNPAAFQVNPDGKATQLILGFLPRNTVAATKGKVDVMFFHAVTDMTAINAYSRNDIGSSYGLPVASSSANPFNYLVYAGTYSELKPSANTTFDVRDKNQKILRSFKVNTIPLTDSAAIIVMTGFANPGVNQNGPKVNLTLITSGGTSITASDVTGIDDNSIDLNGVSVFPNPANGMTTMKYSLENGSSVMINVYDNAGKSVRTINEGRKPAGENTCSFDATGLTPGLYMIELRAGDAVSHQKLMVE